MIQAPLTLTQYDSQSSLLTNYLNLAGYDKAAFSSAQFYKSSKSLDPLWSSTKESDFYPAGKNFNEGYPLTPNL